jgi:hypothetical protein
MTACRMCGLRCGTSRVCAVFACVATSPPVGQSLTGLQPFPAPLPPHVQPQHRPGPFVPSTLLSILFTPLGSACARTYSMAAANADMANGAGAGADIAKTNPLDNYELVQVIGKGSFGTVSKIRRKADGRVSHGRVEWRVLQNRRGEKVGVSSIHLPLGFLPRHGIGALMHTLSAFSSPNPCRSWSGRNSTTVACARRRSSSSSLR